MPLSINGEMIIGMTLITIGVISFARGTSEKIASNSYLKSAHNISNLVNNATRVHNISNNFESKKVKNKKI